MARENQDLQIALIVSVMLTIILGVTTFLCYRQYSDTAKTLKTTQDDLTKAQGETRVARDEVNKLKGFLGVAETESLDAVSNQFNDDMKKYSAGIDPQSQFYRPMVEKLFKTIELKEKELADTKDENQKLNNKYVIRESTKDAQLKQFDDTIKTVTKDLNDRTETFNKDRQRITEDANKVREQLSSAQKTAAADTAKLKSQVDDEAAQRKKTQLIAKKLREDNAGLTNETMDVPDGEIRWVNQRNGTVWINAGKADNLNMLTTFAVYPLDMNNLGKGAKKASIEVTQLLGDHLAEARILEDKVDDPIMPGDKIHTPIWSPGDKRHFALVGYMDINGDGKNNLQLLRNLIVMNGGVVDCLVDDKGKKTGEISVETRYLVEGKKPDEKGDPANLAAYSKLISEADGLGIQKIALSELLERMGYKQQAHVVSFGQGADPKDFKPKPEGGVNRVSAGNVSEIYKPRQPPRSTAGGAY
jgi:hypothetical protein